MNWAFGSVMIPFVAPEPNVSLGHLVTLQHFRAVFPAAGQILWDGEPKGHSAENRAFVLFAFGHAIRTYVATGVLDAVAMKTHIREFGSGEYGHVANTMRFELAIQTLTAHMANRELLVSHLTEPFFAVHIATIVSLLAFLTTSTAHGQVHVDCLGRVLAMHETCRDMMRSYRLTLGVKVANTDLVLHLSHALHYCGVLTQTFWYKNATLCYYLQTIPLAAWAANACGFLHTVNALWRVVPAAPPAAL